MDKNSWVEKFIIINSKLNIGYIINWVFGIVVIANGLLNLFWGNDPVLGVFFLLLSLIYLPPANTLLKKKFGVSIHPYVKIIITILILWVTGAVGALTEGHYPKIFGR